MYVGRDRPSVPHLDGSPVGSSFPSGHVAAAACYVAIAIVAGRNCAKRWIVVTLWTIALATPIIVGLSRMYRGMHFMSDVVAGMILGIVSDVMTRAFGRAWAESDGQGKGSTFVVELPARRGVVPARRWDGRPRAHRARGLEAAAIDPAVEAITLAPRAAAA